MNSNVILTINLLVLGYFALTEMAIITLWGFARLKKQTVAKGLVSTVFIAALPVYFTLFQIAGLMMNFTPSLSEGIYRQVGSNKISRGNIVSYCLDIPEYAALAKERGYLGAGTCGYGLKPLLKYAAGMPGDIIGLTTGGQITINQKPLPGVYLATKDL